jgi:SAM-dependent methyltransferase
VTGPGTAAGDQVTTGFDHIAGRYATAGGEFFTQIARTLVQAAGVRRGDRILDAGCGKGAVTIPAAVAAGPGGHVTGIDTSPVMLEHAAAVARRRNLANVGFFVADAEDPHITDPREPGSLPQRLGPATFDVVLASNVIVFLPDPEKALRSWHRLLRPGGEVAFSWGISGDPRWAPVMAAVDAHVPDGIPGFEAQIRRPPFHDPEAVAALLARCGYADMGTSIAEITTSYDTPEQWWASCRTSAPWAISWRHIPPADLHTARHAASELIEGLRDTAGSITRTLRFGYTVARKPGRGQDRSP